MPRNKPGKVCKHCGLHQPFEEYSAHPETVDRLQVWCKGCVRQAVRDWRANPDNRRREREAARAKAKAKRDQSGLVT